MIWIYTITYIFLIIYSTLKYESVASTAITSTATLVGIIFSGYIFSKTFKKDQANEQNTDNSNIN